MTEVADPSGSKDLVGRFARVAGVASAHVLPDATSQSMIARIFIATLAFFCSSSAISEMLSGRVVSITDGDSIVVLDGGKERHRINLAGIDAPEPLQPFGDRAKTNLARLLLDQTVQVEWSKRDSYRSIVGRVLIKGQDANLEQIKTGLAWWNREHVKELPPNDRENYEVAEFRAKSSRVGLWSARNPAPPWEWRRVNRLAE